MPLPRWSVDLRSFFRAPVQSNSHYEIKHNRISMRKQSNRYFQSCCLKGKKPPFSIQYLLKGMIHICPIVWTCVRRLFCHTKIKSASSWGPKLHLLTVSQQSQTQIRGQKCSNIFFCWFPEWLYIWCGCTEFTHNASFHLPLQDYPSLALLGEKLAENNIFVIFAVTKQLYIIYKVHRFNNKICTFSWLNPSLRSG